MKYRIKQYSEKQFCAQVKIDWFARWESIDIDNPVFTWSDNLEYKKLCIVETMQHAKLIIERHKDWLESKNRYPKFFDIK
jgi:hypothetical protein